ncbi:uncharacterized protein LOC131687584 [Topomyia yanbarensis]|uniref:uncharacterized protein LOC131687584 n=1 Tax=Topomyia yanbarensis TaxID=2498891 RepID=UPI00273B4B6D|nr:uncharacterized protein LOC131687584 [Topomyia yanbarensis]
MVVADVEKMFRQIKIDEGDMPLQRILWRVDGNEEVGTYELTTVTYGTKPAPFLATRTLKQLAMDEQARYPLAAKAASEDVYMDDVLSGADAAEAALELRIQLDEMMAKGRFRLRKWASNCPMVLQGIPEENLAILQTEEVQLDPDPEVRTLGLVWLPVDDVLMFRFKIQELNPVGQLSKRKVLSIIATLFDPLGLIGAVITTAKIFMQLLWCLKDDHGKSLGWDEALPPKVDADWRTFHCQLPLLNDLRIERCVIKPRAIKVELHFFSDASERAYGACAYVRSVDSTGGVRVVLLSSKSKVASLKCQSIPRLELCGALMAAQLAEKISAAIQMEALLVFWTDSTCVLHWLKATPSMWTTFVANRVAKIQAITENHTWQHVPGIQNPADLISRGLTPEQIQCSKLWWKGPPWFQETFETWPKHQVRTSVEDAEKEIRRTAAPCSQQQEEFGTWYVRKFSNFIDLVRRTAYWLRLIKILKRTGDSKMWKGFLKTAELVEAEHVLMRLIQQETFSKEWKALTKK